MQPLIQDDFHGGNRSRVQENWQPNIKDTRLFLLEKSQQFQK